MQAPPSKQLSEPQSPRNQAPSEPGGAESSTKGRKQLPLMPVSQHLPGSAPREDAGPSLSRPARSSRRTIWSPRAGLLHAGPLSPWAAPGPHFAIFLEEALDDSRLPQPRIWPGSSEMPTRHLTKRPARAEGTGHGMTHARSSCPPREYPHAFPAAGSGKSDSTCVPNAEQSLGASSHAAFHFLPRYTV